MKRIFAAALAVLFIFPCFLFGASAQSSRIIVPDGYLSEESLSHLELKAENIYNSYAFDVFFLLSEKAGAYESAQALFEEKGIKSGVVFAMEKGSGNAFITADSSFTESEKSVLLKSYSSVEGGTYSERIEGFLNKAAEFAKERSEGESAESERLRPRFMDIAGVIDDSLESAVYTDIDSFSEKHLSDIVFVIYAGEDEPSVFSEKYYSDYNFGFGEEKSGVILALNSETGELSIEAKGDSQKYFGDKKENEIASSLEKKAKKKDYTGVFIDYLDLLEGAMNTKSEETTQQVALPDDYFPPLEGNIGENGEIMPRVYDGAKILSEANEKEIIEVLDEISDETGMNFIVATVTKIPEGFTAKEYAGRYFSHFSFGGEESDGILLLIAIEPECCFLTAFGKAEKLFGSGALKDYTNSFYSYYRNGNYDEAVHVFVFEAAQRLMKEKLKIPIIAGSVLFVFASALTVGVIS